MTTRIFALLFLLFAIFEITFITLHVINLKPIRLPAIIQPLCPSSPPDKPGEHAGGPWLYCKDVFHQQDT